jgi:hypothetical protein
LEAGAPSDLRVKLWPLSLLRGLTALALDAYGRRPE